VDATGAAANEAAGVEEGRMFFFEKKNQKTFIHSVRRWMGSVQYSKVFCFFFFKKKSFLSGDFA
jgi:hypothetical protein